MERLTSLGLLTLTVALATVAHAQYTADFQTNIISGVISNWSDYFYYVGNTNFADVLLIENGGVLTNYEGRVGNAISSSNNSVSVTGSNSIWRNRGNLYVGLLGSGNSLIISNGGQLKSGSGCVAAPGDAYLGAASANNTLTILDGGHMSVFCGTYIGRYFPEGSNNTALVGGHDSVWSNNTLFVGDSGWRNTLVITNNGQVVSVNGVIGYYTMAWLNSVRVTDGGVWKSGEICVGQFGRTNSLTVAGGFVFATNLLVGAASSTCDNLLRLDSGSVIVTNASTNAVLEVRRGKLVLNGGNLQVDRFVMTNPCAQFVRTGGTLIYGTALLIANLDTDGDGIPNSYEQTHNLDPLNPEDITADADGDGQSNLREYLAGTDPTNASSTLRILNVKTTNADMLVTWQTAGGHTNIVQSATSLTGGYFHVSPNIILPGSSDTTTNYLHAGAATNAASRFYRIRLVP
jgi:T5SS/PEP-CTERM-associated repeat protein